jgi:hypothetical protein
MDGRRYYPVGVFEADASALFPWPPQSRLWRAYVMGYLDFIAGGDNPAKVPGLVTDHNSEAYAYGQGVADATAGIVVPFINEVAPEPPPPIIPETAEGSVMESETDPLFIAGGDNG